ncbi:hypothetical protein M3J09_002914 [Ascochyta lentis]
MGSLFNYSHESTASGAYLSWLWVQSRSSELLPARKASGRLDTWTREAKQLTCAGSRQRYT